MLQSDDDFLRVVSESQVTMRTVPFSSGDVFERVRRFVRMYSQLDPKPSGAALLYEESSPPRAQCRELAHTLTVGRMPKSEHNPDGADLALGDAEMSRRHFEIFFHDGFYLLRDLGSRNGTYLNNRAERIRENVLMAGDAIVAGRSVFVFTGGN